MTTVLPPLLQSPFLNRKLPVSSFRFPMVTVPHSHPNFAPSLAAGHHDTLRKANSSAPSAHARTNFPLTGSHVRLPPITRLVICHFQLAHSRTQASHRQTAPPVPKSDNGCSNQGRPRGDLQGSASATSSGLLRAVVDWQDAWLEICLPCLLRPLVLLASAHLPSSSLSKPDRAR